ncbi:MAG: carbohydrate ABC transporter permease [Spirochaetaceae bacterium]|nr:MAG: carbohydrate ABC transporter permease [Spirochaetaceae bacterium]
MVTAQRSARIVQGRHGRPIAETTSDRLFLAVNTVLLSVILIAVAYPLVFVISASFSNPDAVHRGEMWLLPRGITLEGYTRVFQNSEIWMGYRNTTIYAVLGTLINLGVTLPCAYALSRKDFVGRSVLTVVFSLTMFFSGGIIPLYLVVRGLGLTNTIWAMVLPNAAAMWFIIIARTYFQTTIPKELLDSSQMDGCSNARFFWSVVLPLSSPIVAVLALFYGVGHWNAFFNALIFISSRHLMPLQLILREILIVGEMGASSMMSLDDAEAIAQMARIADLVRYTVMIVASVPVMVAYPFAQRYFTKGIMIGAIKG